MSTEDALAAFGLLADRDRLAVAGAAARGAVPTDDIAAATGLSKRAVLEALTRLESGGLVVPGADGGWSLDVGEIQRLAREARPKPAPDDVGDVAPDKAAVLHRFLRDGRLLSIPMQRRRRLVVLDHIARVFEIGVRYPEREVNAYLRAFHEDVASLRRYLVDERFLTREAGVYWRSGGTVDV
jgi:biotin operon repressor